MEQNYFTVAKVAETLDIHEKTVQRYIREGKLRATKLGKAWRISGHDLSTFLQSNEASVASSKKSNANSTRKIKVSSVIDISVSDLDEAMTIISMLQAALNSKPSEYGKSTMNTQYIEPENNVRIMLYGDIKFTESFMWILSNYTNN